MTDAKPVIPSSILAPAILAPTIRAQQEAADPHASAWVRANAGAGKTYVLATRVLRQLLAGADPAKLLCITYTKAAAAEMANRVFEWLSEWATAPDDDLAQRIAAIEGRRPGPATLKRARRLFAAAVETPGGLKIQTIHAFCERLLQQFPFEASVTAGFTVLDERAASELLAEARNAVLISSANAKPEDPLAAAPLARAVPDLLARQSDKGFGELLRVVLGRRGAFVDWLREAGGLDRALSGLRAELGLDADDDEDTVVADILAGPHLPRTEWATVAACLALGSANDQKAADRLLTAERATDPADRAERYLEVFLTKGKPRKAIITKSLAADYPDLAERLDRERDRIATLSERLAAARLMDGNTALFTVADAVIGRFQTLKNARGVVDFDDLVERTAMLLGRADAGWVLYKLDGGIDHVLVDEAQDTSPRQWEIIERIAAEFFAGEGARRADRTIFAVGDIKQSIYSFQGADPAGFGAMQSHFAKRAEAADKTFRKVPLRLSFRSTPTVLQAVDAVFDDAGAAAGLSLPDEPEAVIHEAVREREPGLVELWEIAEPEAAEEVTPWDAPLDADRSDSPPARLADRIARTIRGWLDSGERLAATGAPIRPGDIMILMARRAPFAEPMIRALKRRAIPVAGADRMVLSEHIAVMDLIAVGRFALMPEDDLNLAALLKSPLIDLSEDELMALAIGRTGSLWQEIRASDDARLTVIRDRLALWRRRAGFTRPYEFYSLILGPDGGRAAFQRRLGAEAFEALEEFLNLALAYERAETPSLPGFLAWLDAAPAEIKRDMDKGRDEVRVMTVHGSKGLEAPIVFLPDTCRTPGGRGIGPLFTLGREFGAPLLWSPSKAADCHLSAGLREEAMRRRREEDNRLLYVAMTRARDRLYVAGFRTNARSAVPEAAWHPIIERVVRPLCETVETADGPVHRYVGAGEPAAASDAVEPTSVQDDDPPWLRLPAPKEAPAPRPVAPSHALPHDRAGEQYADHPDDTGSRASALKRGTILHRLLETLPDLATEQRTEAGARALRLMAPDWPQEQRGAVLGEALAVLDHPDFAMAFAPDSNAEVSIAGALGPDDVPVSGQIDRLAVSDTEIVIVDYKTDRRVPATPGDVPPVYLVQLAAYRALARQIWPGRPIRCALLWTAEPVLMGVPQAVLDAHGLPAPA